MLNRLGRMILGASCALVITLLVTSCSGNQAPVNTGTVPPATPMAGMHREKMMPVGKAAPIPKTLRCKDEIVWVNTAKKVYHEPSDPWYGRTKQGQYMCKAAAEASGNHMAGMTHGAKTMRGEMPTPAPTASY